MTRPKVLFITADDTVVYTIEATTPVRLRQLPEPDVLEGSLAVLHEEAQLAS